ncbi:expressed unknown protein [Seminavis robusta]|uniref:Uncharacterized protein n=1 Tax=Seminavis robusta TaxID=568900 RepID=A0A9N8HAF3_9STRA|nr:expressed unknown protein [Seminavis robusta]|eukprot:Sro146_g067540.1 n/a (343) ;mRNA; r:47987-49015
MSTAAVGGPTGGVLGAMGATSTIASYEDSLVTSREDESNRQQQQQPERQDEACRNLLKELFPKGLVFCDPFAPVGGKQGPILDVFSSTASLEEEDHGTGTDTGTGTHNSSGHGGVPRSVSITCTVPPMSSARQLAELQGLHRVNAETEEEVMTAREPEEPKAPAFTTGVTACTRTTTCSTSRSRSVSAFEKYQDKTKTGNPMTTVRWLLVIFLLVVVGTISSLEQSSHHESTFVVSVAGQIHDHLVDQHIMPSHPARRDTGKHKKTMQQTEKTLQEARLPRRPTPFRRVRTFLKRVREEEDNTVVQEVGRMVVKFVRNIPRHTKNLASTVNRELQEVTADLA